MKSKKKYLFNILFMVVLLVLTFYVLLKDQDLESILKAMKTVNLFWLVMSMICAVLYLVLESLSLHIILASLGLPVKLIRSLKYSFIGFLFNAITPSASGGQPVQVLYMREDGINLGASSVTLLFWTILYKVALVVVEGFVFLFYRAFALEYLDGYMWLFLIGIVVNVVSIVLYSLVVFTKNGAKNIVFLSTRLLQKMHLIRNKERIEKKVEGLIASYQDGAVYMRSHLDVAGVVLLVTLCQRIFYFAVTWCIYRSFGLTQFNLIQIIILQSFVAVCIDILPFPGGVGANEGFFVNLFIPVMGKSVVFSAMLLSRGVSFYALVIVSAVVTLAAQVHNIHKAGKKVQLHHRKKGEKHVTSL